MAMDAARARGVMSMSTSGTGWKARTRALGSAAILAVATACCGTSAFVMGEYNNPGTPAYQCSAPSQTTTGSCSTLGKTNESDWQTGAVHAPLPKGLFAQCPNGVQRLRIANPGAANTAIWYECAVPPQPTTIPTAGPPTASAQ
jgi:hypothetical protein